MDRLIQKYLEDCFSFDSEIKTKIMILRKRGYSINISNDLLVFNNYFSWEKDVKDFIQYYNLPIEKMIDELFSKDSADNFPVINKDYVHWGDLFGSNRWYGSKVSIKSLEPFVARLVRALALCGIFTYYSCDGWHANSRNQLYILFCERYSKLWFKMLLENDKELEVLNLNYSFINCEFNICYDENNMIDTFMKVDKLAEIMYRNREAFNYSKRLVIEKYKGHTKSSLNDEEIIDMFLDGYLSVKETVKKKINYRSEDQEQALWFKLKDDNVLLFIAKCNDNLNK